MFIYFIASFCASCAAGEIWEKGHLSESEYAWWGGCCLYAALIENGCCCLYGIMYTGQIREKKGIDGSCFGDCMAGCFCPCCAHTRNLREVRGT